ncbi:MAG: DUF5074 domain-containing protein [Bacteroidota bacterium]
MIIVSGLLFLVSCTLDDDSNINGNKDCPAGKTFSDGVYVLNEGNFGSGNGGISWISGSLQLDDAFNCANGYVAGDVVQSLTVQGNIGYLVVNNSQKIEIVDMNTMVSSGRIFGLRSPRYMLQTGEDKAYVTDLYDDSLAMLSISQRRVLKKIPASGWTNKMVRVNGKVYVTQRRSQNDTRPGGNNILVIDPNFDRVTDSIGVGKGITEIVADASGSIWVLTEHGPFSASPSVVRINTNTKALTSVNPIIDSLEARALVTDSSANLVYYINGGVYRIKTTQPNPAPELIIQRKGRRFYGLGISPKGEILVSDAKDYTVNGTVLRYTPEGVLKDTFQAGIIPNSFIFRK